MNATPKILVPVDGSGHALTALRFALARAARDGSEVHVLNVRTPVPQAVSDFVRRENIDSFYREEAEADLTAARALLKDSGAPGKVAVLIGSPADAIAQYVRDNAVTEVIMGRRGLGRLAGLLMGSVATQVLHLVDVPVTLVK
jgi:nucleotide-binding universal stress UspA family protein